MWAAPACFAAALSQLLRHTPAVVRAVRGNMVLAPPAGHTSAVPSLVVLPLGSHEMFQLYNLEESTAEELGQRRATHQSQLFAEQEDRRENERGGLEEEERKREEQETQRRQRREEQRQRDEHAAAAD